MLYFSILYSSSLSPLSLYELSHHHCDVINNDQQGPGRIVLGWIARGGGGNYKYNSVGLYASTILQQIFVDITRTGFNLLALHECFTHVINMTKTLRTCGRNLFKINHSICRDFNPQIGRQFNDGTQLAISHTALLSERTCRSYGGGKEQSYNVSKINSFR